MVKRLPAMRETWVQSMGWEDLLEKEMATNSSVYNLFLKKWGGRREEGSGWGTHVYLWRIHFDIWQN